MPEDNRKLNVAYSKSQISQIVYFDELASFVDYVNSFKTNQTRVFLVSKSGCLQAFFDYHAVADNGMAILGSLQHQAIKTSLFSYQWLKWRNVLDQGVETSEFLSFLQDFVPFVYDAGIDKLEQFLTSASAISGCELTSLRLLPSGATCVGYRKGGRRRAITAQVEFPHELWLSTPILASGPHVFVTIQFRYKLVRSELLVWPRIFELEEIERTALHEIREDLVGELGMPIFIGNPALDRPGPAEVSTLPQGMASMAPNGVAERSAVAVNGGGQLDPHRPD